MLEQDSKRFDLTVGYDELPSFQLNGETMTAKEWMDSYGPEICEAAVKLTSGLCISKLESRFKTFKDVLCGQPKVVQAGTLAILAQLLTPGRKWQGVSWPLKLAEVEALSDCVTYHLDILEDKERNVLTIIHLSDLEADVEGEMERWSETVPDAFKNQYGAINLLPMAERIVDAVNAHLTNYRAGDPSSEWVDFLCYNDTRTDIDLDEDEVETRETLDGLSGDLREEVFLDHYVLPCVIDRMNEALGVISGDRDYYIIQTKLTLMGRGICLELSPNL